MSVTLTAPRAVQLAAFIREVWDRPFSWGEWDCNLFCVAWLDRLTGQDEYTDFAGNYDSEEGAREFLRRRPTSLAAVLVAGAGCVEVSPGVRFAQPGDFLLVDDPEEPWYRGHVCAGRNFVSVWPGQNGGFRSYPMEKLPVQTLVLRLPCPR